MPDPQSIVNALQSLKAAIDVVKALHGAEISFEKAELKFKIAELAESLANARIAVLEAQEEIRQLQDRIGKLRKVEHLRSQLELRNNVYVIADDEKKTKYCPRCFEVDSILIPVSILPIVFQQMGTYKCPNCKATY